MSEEHTNTEHKEIEPAGIVQGSETVNTQKENNSQEDAKAPKVSKHALQKAQHRRQQRADFAYVISEGICPVCAADLSMSFDKKSLVCTKGQCNFRFDIPQQTNG